jgi:hypothetical protein
MFGDLPWELWCQPDGAPSESRRLFCEAWEALKGHDRGRACALLREITERPGHAAHTYAQAWHFLRDLGVAPPPERGKHVFGAIVEVTMPRGFDVVGAYEDHTARYWNLSNSGAIWDRPDDTLDSCIDAILEAARGMVAATEPHASSAPPPPERGTIQMSCLTPSGLHLGRAAPNGIVRDPVAGPVIAGATELLEKLETLRGVHPDR